MLKSTMADNRILQPPNRDSCVISACASVNHYSLIVYKTNGHKRPPTFINREFAAGLFKTHRFREKLAFSICSLFRGNCAVNACGSLGKIKAQKNPAIKDWIAGHNIVRIALYCKRINSHFPFSYIIRSVSEVLHIGMKWRCFILWSFSETMLHLSRRIYEARLTAYEAARCAMKRTCGA